MTTVITLVHRRSLAEASQLKAILYVLVLTPITRTYLLGYANRFDANSMPQ
jgi:hypothetical protein